MATATSPRTSTKSDKASRGRTAVDATPMSIRSRMPLPEGFDQLVRKRLSRQFEHAASLIERVTIRFEDINGPRGGIDTICRIKLVLSGRPSVQVEEREATATTAFGRAASKVKRALEKEREQHKLATRARRPKPAANASHAAAKPANGEIIGRRVGRGAAAVARALDRPEKRRRDAVVDTAAPGTAASHRKAGGGMTARRNTRGRTTKATATLEDSQTKPSRKSTRKSANRGKTSQGKERNAVAQSVTPRAKAARAKVARR